MNRKEKNTSSMDHRRKECTVGEEVATAPIIKLKLRYDGSLGPDCESGRVCVYVFAKISISGPQPQTVRFAAL